MQWWGIYGPMLATSVLWFIVLFVLVGRLNIMQHIDEWTRKIIRWSVDDANDDEMLRWSDRAVDATCLVMQCLCMVLIWVPFALLMIWVSPNFNIL